MLGKTKKKFLLLTALLVIATFIFSGCELVVAYGITIHKDGSGEVSIKELIDEEFYESMNSENTESSEDLEPMEFNGKDYYGSEDVRDCDDLNDIIDELEDTDAFTDVEITPYSFSATYEPADEYDGTSAESLDTYGVKISSVITVTFDSKIVDTNGEISEDDPNTVIWDLKDLDEETELYAKASHFNILFIIIPLIVVVVIAIIVVVVVISSKKKAAKNDDEATPEQINE